MADCAGVGRLCLRPGCERSGAVLVEGEALARLGDRKVELSGRNHQMNSRTDVKTLIRGCNWHHLGGKS